jgi:hypothetical protein
MSTRPPPPKKKLSQELRRSNYLLDQKENENSRSSFEWSSEFHVTSCHSFLTYSSAESLWSLCVDMRVLSMDTGIAGSNRTWGLGGASPNLCNFKYKIKSTPALLVTQHRSNTAPDGEFALPDYDQHLVSRSKNEWRYTSTPPIRLHGVVFS